MNITTDFQTAEPTKKSWSGVFGYTPDQPSQLEFLGEMFAVISIKSEIQFDLANIGNLLQDELQSSYFKPIKEDGNLQNLENSLKSVSRRIEQIMDREEELAEDGIDFEMLAMIIKDKVLYVAVVGESKIVVSRGDDSAEISGVLIDSEMDGFARVGSLELEPDDRLMILTSDAFGQLKEKGVSEALAHFDITKLSLKKGSLVQVGYDLSPEFLESLVSDEEEEAKAPESIVAAAVSQTKSAAGGTDSNDQFIEDDLEEESDTKDLSIDSEDESDFEEEDEYYDDEDDALGIVAKLTTSIGLAIGSVRSKLMRKSSTDGLENLDDDNFEAEIASSPENLDVKMLDNTEDRFDRLKSLDADKSKSEVEETEVQGTEDYELDSIDDSESDSGIVSKATNILTGVISKVPKLGSIKGLNKIDISNLKGGESVTNALQKAKEGVRSIRHGRPGSRETFIRGGRKPGLNIDAKWKFFGVVLVVAVVIVVFGVKQTIADNEVRAYEQGVLDQITALEGELGDLTIRANTASIGSDDPSIINSILNEFEGLANRSAALKAEELEVSRLDNIVSSIQIEKDTMLKVNAFTQPQVVVDLAVNFQGVNTSDIDYSGGSLYISDEGRGVIYKAGASIGSEANIFVNGLVEPRLMTVEKDGDLVFLDSGSESVLGVVNIDNGNVRRQPGLTAPVIGPITSMFVWKNNGALYTLHNNRRAILKRSTASGNYVLGDGEVWRTDGTLANAIDIAVNGSVYVLIQGSGLKRYFGSEPASFSIKGIIPSLKQSIDNSIAFDLTSNRIYVLDKIGQRIIVLSIKNANNATYQYEEQIVYRGTENIFTDLKDIKIVAGRSSERIFVLDGSRVIRIDR